MRGKCLWLDMLSIGKRALATAPVAIAGFASTTVVAHEVEAKVSYSRHAGVVLNNWCDDPLICAETEIAEMSRQFNAASNGSLTRTYTLSRSYPSAQTINGKPRTVGYDVKVVTTVTYSGGTTTTTTNDPGFSFAVGGVAVCDPRTRGVSAPGSTIDNQIIHCVTPTQTDPPPRSCPATDRPVFAENGLKYQSEIDYQSGNLRFERIYRSDIARFAVPSDAKVLIGTAAPASAASPAGCFAGYYELYQVSETPTGLVSSPVQFPHCFPSVASSTPETEVVAVNGNQNLFTDSGTTLAPKVADINQQIIRLVGTNGAVTHALRTEKNAIEQYASDGLLTTRHSASGEVISFTYSTASTPTAMAPRGGLLIGMVNQHGRGLALTYNSDGNLETLTDPAAGVVRYTYDEPSGNCPTSFIGGKCRRLTSVIYADGKVRRYHYNELTHIDPVLNRATAYLTGITDEAGQRLSNYKYNAQARVRSSGWGGFEYQLAYGDDSYGDGGATVTDLMGSQRVLSYRQVLGRKRMISQSQPAGSGCAASTSAMSYDANGNVASEDDFNGNRVCRSHDLSRNLESVRVQGLPTTQTCSAVTAAGATLPALSRKISTQWHPDWRLASKVAEPGRITTSVYNGQPDPFNANAIASCAPASALLPDGKPIAVLCKTVEQATTDADGALGFSAALQSGVAAREQKWSFNQYGQVLTHDGPRTDVSDLTTYAYYTDTVFTGAGANAVGHTVGDLQRVTNAAGKITNYTKYNKHGQLLETIDPNGVVTTNTYDLRQRLLSTSVGGQATSYSYDAAGQLTRVTRPDASWIGYEYDAAHRQTAVLDNRGNRIDYTLDNAGNKTGQAVKDPGGALRRTLARSIDALGRVQQTTGRE